MTANQNQQTFSGSQPKTLREALLALKESNASDLKPHAFDELSPEAVTRLNPDRHYRGKVRNLIVKGSEIFMAHSDRLSAFDRFIGLIPYKGAILANIAEHWLKGAEAIIPTHLLSYPHPRVLHTRNLTPFKVEVIVRGFLAGSMQRSYEAGVRDFCGNRLPEGLKGLDPLPEAIITPTTKAEVFEHDEETNRDELIANGVLTRKEWDYIEAKAFELFRWGQAEYEKLGWTLVDTKYEFGKDAEGRIYLIDEIHTPDSSRLWKLPRPASGAPQMFDKENVRRWLMDKGFKGEGEVPTVPAGILVDLLLNYLRVAESLRGEPLPYSPAMNDVEAAIASHR